MLLITNVCIICSSCRKQRAAKRLTKYWEKRLDIFGPDKAFLPLTQEMGLQDDSVALHMGLAKVIPNARDPAGGLCIIFFDPSKQDRTKYDRLSMVRAIWYTMHAVLEDEQTQRFGIVTIVFPKNAKISQFDRQLENAIVASVKGLLPVRMSAFHVCQPPIYSRLIWPIVKIFLGERLRKRVQVHGGSQEVVLDKLARFGLSKDVLPSELGGTVELDHDLWSRDLRAAGK